MARSGPFLTEAQRGRVFAMTKPLPVLLPQHANPEDCHCYD
jgi:hypothetical protein